MGANFEHIFDNKEVSVHSICFKFSYSNTTRAMAKTEDVGLIFADITRCMICFEDYTDDRKPNKLPCDHFFCAICTDLLGQGGAIRCPICQQVTQFEDVRTDFRAIQFLDIMKKMQDTTERLEQMSLEGRRGPQASAETGSEEDDEDNGLCEFCKMNEAQSWCDACKKRLCVSCAAAHPNIPVFESHKIAPLVDAVSRFADVLTIEIEKAKDQIEELRDARAEVDAMFVAVKEKDNKANDWLNENKGVIRRSASLTR